MSNRHVPLITGVVALVAGIGLSVWSLWLTIPGALLLWFGWVSIKTGLGASDEEIAELTGQSSMSETTKQKFSDRA
jgi:hypothetical protein